MRQVKAKYSPIYRNCWQLCFQVPPNLHRELRGNEACSLLNGICAFPETVTQSSLPLTSFSTGLVSHRRAIKSNREIVEFMLSPHHRHNRARGRIHKHVQLQLVSRLGADLFTLVCVRPSLSMTGSTINLALWITSTMTFLTVPPSLPVDSVTSSDALAFTLFQRFHNR